MTKSRLYRILLMGAFIGSLSLLTSCVLCDHFHAKKPAAPIYSELAASIKPMIDLEQGWSNPPRIARTRVWWWWLNGNVTQEAITRDLEEMKSKGIGGANIIDAAGDDQRGNRRVPHGPDFATPEWRRLFIHALSEADRLGLELGFNIQSGWNLGGPIVTPEESAKILTYSEMLLHGGKRIVHALDKPKNRDNYYRDIAVVAVPAPANQAATERIKHFEEKAYYRYPGRFTATEAWHLAQVASEPAGAIACYADQVIDLSDKLDRDGRLIWDAPEGRWIVLRFGYTISGSRVSTSSQGWQGLAIDYLDASAFESYWQKVLEPVFAEAKPRLGKSLRFLHTDSWELGPVNWTPKMPQQFRQLRQYDLTPYLPVLANYVVDSQEVSTRFLNDFRRTLADLIASNNYLLFSRCARGLGLGIHPESGGPHAAPVDALRNLGINDIPMGEFWAPSATHRVKPEERFFVKQTASAAHVYGRRLSLAEAFTCIGPHWEQDPRSLKAAFDRAACEGHNLTMWHTFDCSPKEMGIPGQAYFAGTHLNPQVTWWNQAGAFIGYLNRCHFLLQQGLPVSDVLYFYGENIPSFVRLKADDPSGAAPEYDYDVIDLTALLARTRVDETGSIVLPDGTAYRLLSIPPYDVMSLPALKHIAFLVSQGASLVGRKPDRPYSLTDSPKADREFAELAGKLWGSAERSDDEELGSHSDHEPIGARPVPRSQHLRRSKGPRLFAGTPGAPDRRFLGTNQPGERVYGRGRVFQGMTSREALERLGVLRDFCWRGGSSETFIDYIHRRTDEADIYFVANRNNRSEAIEAMFRVYGRQPEIWDPVTGIRRVASAFHPEAGQTIVPLELHGEQSLFVIFRKPVALASKGNAPRNFPRYSVSLMIEGPWTAHFDPRWGGPESAVFKELEDWSLRSEEGIRYYSGAAVYEKTFQWPGSVKQNGQSLVLDLGELKNVAEVILNGQNLGVLWSYPFRADITDSLRAGFNELQIRIVNLWPNRLIGDQQLPSEKRRTRTNITKFERKDNQKLLRSGLFGPVTILQADPMNQPMN